MSVISPSNEAPSIENIKPVDGQDIQVNEGFVYDADAVDPDGDNLTYKWDFQTGVSESKTGTWVYSSMGDYEITVTVTDPGGLSDNKSIVINVITKGGGVSGGLPSDWEDEEAKESGIGGLPRGLLFYPVLTIYGFSLPLWFLLVVLVIIMRTAGDKRKKKELKNISLFIGVVLVLLIVNWLGVM
jgi:hypothetical protein